MLTRKRFREDPEASFYSETDDWGEKVLEYRDRNGQLHDRDGSARTHIHHSGHHTEERWLHGSTREVDLAIPTRVVFYHTKSILWYEAYSHRGRRYDIRKSFISGEPRYSIFDTNHIYPAWSSQRLVNLEIQKHLSARNKEVVEQFDNARQEVSLVLLPVLADIVLDYLIVLPFPECPTTTSAASV